MDVLPGTAASTIVVGQTDASEQTPPMRPVAGSFEKFNSYFAAESTVLLVGRTPKIPLSEPDPSMVFQDNVEQTAAAGRTSDRGLDRSARARSSRRL
jgi:hypothetical protein